MVNGWTRGTFTFTNSHGETYSIPAYFKNGLAIHRCECRKKGVGKGKFWVISHAASGLVIRANAGSLDRTIAAAKKRATWFFSLPIDWTKNDQEFMHKVSTHRKEIVDICYRPSEE